MSTNQYSKDFQHTQRWEQHKMASSTTGDNSYWVRFRHDDVDQQLLEPDKEPLFEKPLTPSDVGKLNRLVIPKQHAENYLPLLVAGGGGLAAGAASGEKGVLLGFEDEEGKLWRFRYSYWSSSQSYVLTKGWSRYVKEKHLDAGDVVFFHRHPREGGRLFIGCRKSGTTVPALGCDLAPVAHHNNNNYQSEYPHAVQIVENQTPVSGNLRTLRLFGVNLECQLDDQWSEPSSPHGSTHQHSSYSHQPCTDVNFSGDVNQMCNR